jgi:hypothetical protein
MTGNDLSSEALLIRQIVVDKACRLYIDTGKTLNITEALRLYLQNDANPEEIIPLMITAPGTQRLRQVLKSTRPDCIECGEQLKLGSNVVDASGKIWATAWTCASCGMIYYSNKTPADWLKELTDEARQQNIRRPHKPV